MTLERFVRGWFVLLPAAALALSGRAARAVTCSALPNPVYVSGSTVIKPIIAAVATSLAPTVTVIYAPTNGCSAVGYLLNAETPTSKGTYWNSSSAAIACDSFSATPNIAVSDLFPTSCPGVVAAQLTSAGVADFQPFIETQMFAVPLASTHGSISAEAAYMTFGFGDSGASNWQAASPYAGFFIRDVSSNTQMLLGLAIKLQASKWLGIDSNSGGGVVNALSSYGSPNQAIGILSADIADASRNVIKRLAYQDYGQTCAYWPDSTFASQDKARVRDGHYQLWGPAHLLAKATNNVPTSSLVKSVIDRLFVANAPLKSAIDAMIATNLVPECAMIVRRTSELGPLVSVQPRCNCYFDAIKGKQSETCVPCTEANATTKCMGATSKCTLGFCEAL